MWEKFNMKKRPACDEGEESEHDHVNKHLQKWEGSA
jgi:hypothetical protein